MTRLGALGRRNWLKLTARAACRDCFCCPAAAERTVGCLVTWWFRSDRLALLLHGLPHAVYHSCHCVILPVGFDGHIGRQKAVACIQRQAGRVSCPLWQWERNASGRNAGCDCLSRTSWSLQPNCAPADAEAKSRFGLVDSRSQMAHERAARYLICSMYMVGARRLVRIMYEREEVHKPTARLMANRMQSRQSYNTSAALVAPRDSRGHSGLSASGHLVPQ